MSQSYNSLMHRLRKILETTPDSSDDKNDLQSKYEKLLEDRAEFEKNPGTKRDLQLLIDREKAIRKRLGQLEKEQNDRSKSHSTKKNPERVRNTKKNPKRVYSTKQNSKTVRKTKNPFNSKHMLIKGPTEKDLKKLDNKLRKIRNMTEQKPQSSNRRKR